MEIVESFVPEATLEAFADQYGLVMELYEREEPREPGSRFYAHFRHTDVMDNEMLVGVYGNGATPEQAIANYGPEISLRRIAVGYGSERREIKVPRIVSG